MRFGVMALVVGSTSLLLACSTSTETATRTLTVDQRNAFWQSRAVFVETNKDRIECSASDGEYSRIRDAFELIASSGRFKIVTQKDKADLTVTIYSDCGKTDASYSEAGAIGGIPKVITVKSWNRGWIKFSAHGTSPYLQTYEWSQGNGVIPPTITVTGPVAFAGNVISPNIFSPPQGVDWDERLKMMLKEIDSGSLTR